MRAAGRLGRLLVSHRERARTWNEAKLALCRWRRAERVPAKPRWAVFEMASVCNLRCPLCNTGGLRDCFPQVERGVMAPATFRQVLDTLLPELRSALFYSWGEPFLNPDLAECVRYAHARDVATQVSSNMMRYTGELGQALIEGGLDRLVVSCDGTTEESYARYRCGGRLATVVRNVEDLLARRRAAGRRTPAVEMQFIVFRHNEHEREAYRRFWTERGASVRFLRMS
jgi:MoaA/NifB/PqqE/SkfB family radical SAM enzyme